MLITTDTTPPTRRSVIANRVIGYAGSGTEAIDPAAESVGHVVADDVRAYGGVGVVLAINPTAVTASPVVHDGIATYRWTGRRAEDPTPTQGRGRVSSDVIIPYGYARIAAQAIDATTLPFSRVFDDVVVAYA